MSTEYREHFPPQHLAPLDARKTDFDWAAVFEALGEPEPDNEQFKSLAFVVQRLLSWFADVDLGRRGAEVIIARRVISLAWTVNPALFDESPSLAALARKLRIDRMSLSKHASDARRTFDVRNRAQSHAWNYSDDTQANGDHPPPPRPVPTMRAIGDTRAKGARARALPPVAPSERSEHGKGAKHVNGHRTRPEPNGASKGAVLNGNCHRPNGGKR